MIFSTKVTNNQKIQFLYISMFICLFVIIPINQAKSAPDYSLLQFASPWTPTSRQYDTYGNINSNYKHRTKIGEACNTDIEGRCEISNRFGDRSCYKTMIINSGDSSGGVVNKFEGKVTPSYSPSMPAIPNRGTATSTGTTYSWINGIGNSSFGIDVGGTGLIVPGNLKYLQLCVRKDESLIKNSYKVVSLSGLRLHLRRKILEQRYKVKKSLGTSYARYSNNWDLSIHEYIYDETTNKMYAFTDTKVGYRSWKYFEDSYYKFMNAPTRGYNQGGTRLIDVKHLINAGTFAGSSKRWDSDNWLINEMKRGVYTSLESLPRFIDINTNFPNTNPTLSNGTYLPGKSMTNGLFLAFKDAVTAAKSKLQATKKQINDLPLQFKYFGEGANDTSPSGLIRLNQVEFVAFGIKDVLRICGTSNAGKKMCYIIDGGSKDLLESCHTNAMLALSNKMVAFESWIQHISQLTVNPAQAILDTRGYLLVRVNNKDGQPATPYSHVTCVAATQDTTKYNYTKNKNMLYLVP